MSKVGIGVFAQIKIPPKRKPSITLSSRRIGRISVMRLGKYQCKIVSKAKRMLSEKENDDPERGPNKVFERM